MADLRSTVDLIKKRKQAIDEAAGIIAPAIKSVPPPPATEDDLLSDTAIDAELKKRKAAQTKKGWFW
jgi:hypothetical protein